MASALNVAIRPEAPIDAAAVRTVNTAAFPTAAEADLVAELHHQNAVVVSLVAEVEGRIVGHVLFSPIETPASTRILGLAPMAVVPELQSRGIGSRLVTEGLSRCRELGYQAVVVLGHPEYYPRFGFVPASQYGFTSEYDVPAEVFMALELAPGALREVRGLVQYHPAFGQI